LQWIGKILTYPKNLQGGKCLVSGPIFDLLDKCFLQIFAQTKENGTLRILKAQELHIAFD